MTDEPDIYSDDEAWWPPGQVVSAEETVDVVCVGCGLKWHVHVDLRGSRLKCRCGEWVVVPAATPSTEGVAASAPVLGSREPGGPVVRIAQGASARLRREAEPHPEGGLVHGSVHDRARWTDRTLIELGLMMVAFFVPSLFLLLGTSGTERAVMTPLAGLATSVLVFLVALGSHRYAFEGLRRTSPAYFGEALLATGAALAFAWAWMQLLRTTSFAFDGDPFQPIKDEIGLAMVIFVVGVVPGIFEEIAFRGLVQGRLTVLFGRSQGILVTGLAFALAHGGVTLAFPIHAGIGIYLCWLRARCGSLLPGMMLHFLYNTTLVVTGI